MSYLVSLLTGFAHPDPSREDPLDRPLAFLLDEAFRTTGSRSLPAPQVARRQCALHDWLFR